MKAMIYRKYGTADVLRYVDIDVPTIADDAGLHRGDGKAVQNRLHQAVLTLWHEVDPRAAGTRKNATTKTAMRCCPV